MKPLLCLAILALTGCTTTRYVRISCIDGEQYNKLRDAEPPKVHDRLTGKANEDVKTLGGSAVRLRAYSQGLLTVLGGCTG